MKQKKNRKQIEMQLGHDGSNWILSGESISLSAPELDDLDRKLEAALKPEWEKEPLEVFFKSNNDMIPEWIRPYMDHYFNRILELPLQY